MASFKYDPKRGVARIFFRFGGVQFSRVEPVESERQAERMAAQIEETILDVERGKLAMPPDADAKTFIMTGGRVHRPVGLPAAEPSEPEPAPTLAEVFDLYFDTLTKGSKSASSLVTERVHSGHIKRIFGASRKIDDLTIAAIQRYVDKRAKQGMVRETLKKELATLRFVWNWAYKRKHVAAPPPWRPDDLTLPKGRQKPPFMTWEQIERRIGRGDLNAEAQAELWECLWLDKGRTRECLDWVRANAKKPFAHPMFVFAAYTGARRGEMVRSERTDWDFDGGIVRIRQKKSEASMEFTTRDVSLHPTLAGIMRDWFAATPGAIYAIEDDARPLTIVGATKAFRATVDGGPWSVLRGWHVFRHSLASNMAAAGVDQRVIDATLGHSTDAMARRYRHLLPSKQTDAIRSVFDD
jgi:integrase